MWRSMAGPSPDYSVWHWQPSHSWRVHSFGKSYAVQVQFPCGKLNTLCTHVCRAYIASVILSKCVLGLLGAEAERQLVVAGRAHK